MATGSLEDTEALDLREGISLTEAAEAASITKPDGTVISLGFDGSGNPKPGGVFDAQGRVPLHIIRPGIGKGRGRHLYEAKMLQEAAGTFTGWKMFLNHLSPEAKKAAGGLPRDIRDSGGRVQESWWDPTTPPNTDAGHGEGSVMGMVRPVKFIRNLIDDDPALAEASISASATGVQSVTRDGQRVWLVEGIQPRGSVDWVTEAGAGGRIVPMLQEAYSSEEDIQMALLESMSDEELSEHLVTYRPGLLQEAGDGDAEDKKDGGKDELAEKTAELVKKGMPEAMARKAAAKHISESNDGDPTTGGEVAEITKEALSEALTSNPDLLVSALQESGDTQVFIASLVEAKLEEERGEIRAEARADVDRAFQLSKLERQAHGVIAESKLPPSWQEGLRKRFSLSEANEPSAELDVVDKVDGDGKVEKKASEVLKEAVDSAIAEERGRLAEANPTRVRGTVKALAEAKPAKKDKPDDAKDDAEDDAPAAVEESSYWAQTLREAGIRDPEKAYAQLEG